VLTEFILENTLAGYNPDEIVSLLSCFVFQEKTDSEPLLTERLKEGRRTIVEIAERVGKVQDWWKVGSGDGEVEGRFKAGLMEVVYEWARGMVSLRPLTLLSFFPCSRSDD